ncbi:MAG: hypothetical protein AAGI38_20445 [Bacteroidota bacterium]
MKQLYFLLALLLGFPLQHFAGNDPNPAVGARAISLGYAYTGIRGDFWTIFHNPAGMVGTPGVSVGAYYERRFGLRELTYGSAGAVIPFMGKHYGGIEMGSFGFDAYRESRIALGYATELLDRVAIGVKAHYNNLNIQNYGSTNSIFASIGINTKVTEELHLGFSVYNANRARLQTESGEENIPTVITAGLAYQPNEKFLIVSDVQKDVDHPVSFRFGTEYKLLPYLAARIGVSTEPLSWNAGLGVNWEDFYFDFAFGFHERLGYSPHVSLSYNFGTPETPAGS